MRVETENQNYQCQSSKLYLTQKVYFSAAAQCRLKNRKTEDSIKKFGPSGGPYGAGFNFELQATFEIDKGSTDFNFSQWLWDVIILFDHKSINVNLNHFKLINPTIENIINYIYDHLNKSELPIGVKIVSLKLKESEELWVEKFIDIENDLLLTKQIKIQSVHRHHNPSLSDEENENLYKKCSQFHGHSYLVEVTIRGKINDETGLIIYRDEFDKSLTENLINPFHLTRLNDQIGNTSGEILTKYWSEICQKKVKNFSHLVVRETRKNAFSWIQ